MKFVILLGLSLAALVTAQNTANSNLLCYYDGKSSVRTGLSQLKTTDLEPALQFCTHLVYGYARISESNKLVSSDEKLDLDIGSNLYTSVTDFKKKFPHLKVLLSVGGDKDEDPDNSKYLTILENANTRVPFINSAYKLLSSYNFDGLDLAWQFPKDKAKKVHGKIGTFVKWLKKPFTGDFVPDEKAEEHKEEFTALVGELKDAFRRNGYLLGLSVLPNVNSTLFYDVRAIINKLDYVNLHAYDYQTPERNPEVADYPAPIYELNDRKPNANIKFQVQHWLDNGCPATKINVVIPAFARAWKMTEDSGLTGLPPVAETDGAAPAGTQTNTPGLLSWPEVCAKLSNPANQHLKGADGPLRKVGDPTKRFGNYAYRSADDKGENGIWVGYDDPETASNKAAFAKLKGLGGVALMDLSFDDFRGACANEKYPILRAIKFRL